MAIAPEKKSDQDDIVATVRRFLATLPSNDGLNAAIAEGEAIAAIIKTLHLPAEIIAAVLVYPAFREELLDENRLNIKSLSNLSRFVIGLKKLNQFSLPANWQPGEALAVPQSEALRKMLLAVVSDVRLVVVRIAEQLLRLRAARNATRDVQQFLAVETREIYAALANRLGVWQLKWELEDFSFRYLDPDTYLDITRALDEKRAQREHFIEQVKAELLRELNWHGISAKVSGRPKHIYSIWRKMQRKERDLDALNDIRAVRILVTDIKECYGALGIVHNLWSYLPGEFDDYIANPKENDYRSLHTAVIGPEGKTIEVQIRSHEMHEHAELGIAAHWRYKEGGPSHASFDKKITFLRQLLEPVDDGAELLDTIRDDFFEDRVYAVSPKGDVLELPALATPLDFAYHVHTLVGHRCRGAKVNGRIVPLTYHIQNGDQVQIITGSQAQPSRDWLSPKLGYLAGARARAKVRSWYRLQDREQHLRQGREILDREMVRLSVPEVDAGDIATRLKQISVDGLCVSLGAGDLTSASIATALQKLRGIEAPSPKPMRLSKRNNNTPDAISVVGVGNLLCNFARCCRPVPAEPIGGYITQGRGVSIHRQDCGNFLSLNQRNPERVLETGWGTSGGSAYPVDLTLRAFDRNGLIRDITTVLADEGANVLNMESRTDQASMQVIMELNVEIRDLPTLSTVITRLEQLRHVVSVRRKT